MSCNQPTKSGKPCKWRKGHCKWHTQDGGNIVTDARDAIQRRIDAIREGPKNGPSSRLQKFLDSKAGNKVVKLELARKPVLTPIQKIADVISLGAYSRKKRDLDYDDAWHNFLLVTLDDGKTYKLEKNETVVQKPASAKDLAYERFDVSLKGKELSLKEMVANAADSEGFWKYRADSNNCQKFTRDIIQSNGLLPDEPGPEHVIQDAPQLMDTIPASRTIANAVTDTAAIADRVLHGDGLKKKARSLVLRYL